MSPLSVLALAVALLSGMASAQIVRSEGSTRSSVTCSSAAQAQSYSDESNASANAVAKAFKEGCSGYTTEVLKAWEADYENDFGVAFASAVTNVDAACETSGVAFGCSSAEAYATAYAEASAEAHASAVAKAAQECPCLKTKAKSLSFGEAATYIELIAEATSLVKAAACAENGSAASASAYQKCIGKAVAKVFAKATADAFIQGDCYNAAAGTQIEADTGSDYFTLEGCEPPETSTTGGGMTDVMGSGSASATDLSSMFADFQMGLMGR